MGQDRGIKCKYSVMEYITFGSCVRCDLFGIVFVNNQRIRPYWSLRWLSCLVIFWGIQVKWTCCSVWLKNQLPCKFHWKFRLSSYEVINRALWALLQGHRGRGMVERRRDRLTNMTPHQRLFFFWCNSVEKKCNTVILLFIIGVKSANWTVMWKCVCP